MPPIDQSITDFLDRWENDPTPINTPINNAKRGKGRPATGRSTRTVRVPKDLDLAKAMQMYYDWLPIIEEYRDTVQDAPNSVRNEKIVKLFQELGI